MEITADQRELQDLVRRFLHDAVPSEYLRKRVTSGLRRDEALYESLKSLGLEEGFAQDGGLSFSELGLVAEEVGRALFPEALLERILGDCIVPGFLSEASKAAYAALGSGTAFAPSSCCDLTHNAKTRKVSGQISWALGVEGATRLIGCVKHGKGTRLFAVGLKQAGVTVKPVSSLDLTSSLNALSLKDVGVTVFSEEESRIITDLYEALKACEVYGITSRVVEMSADYLKTREQFGVPIGAFQAVQQRLADAYAQSESLGALSRFAAWSVTRSPEQLPLTARAAISQASEVGPLVCEAAIQVHGGIGFTWEYDLHLFLRRAKAIQVAYGMSGARVNELLDRARG